MGAAAGVSGFGLTVLGGSARLGEIPQPFPLPVGLTDGGGLVSQISRRRRLGASGGANPLVENWLCPKL